MKNATGTIITLAVVGGLAYALYEWLLSECETTGSSLYGGSICGMVPGVNIPVAAASATPTLAATTTPAVIPPTTAVLTNVTTPNGAFQAGDSFQLVITGPPNSPIIGTASQNGAVSSSSPFGSTDGTGRAIITGTWGAGDVGQWQESWQAGNGAPVPLSFQVYAAGVSGLGFTGSNRMPANFVNAGRPIIPGQGMTAPVGYMNPGSVNRFPVQVFHRNS
jgi:hypothetical protein